MIIRPTARLIVLDDAGRILLLQFEDPSAAVSDDPRPGLSEGIFWCTPGGGVETGETFEEAARRELREETGIVGVVLGPCVYVEEKAVPTATGTVHFHQRFYEVRVPTAVISIDAHTELERHFYRDHRWWTQAELETTVEAVFPDGLSAIVRSLL